MSIPALTYTKDQRAKITGIITDMIFAEATKKSQNSDGCYEVELMTVDEISIMAEVSVVNVETKFIPATRSQSCDRIGYTRKEIEKLYVNSADEVIEYAYADDAETEQREDWN